MTAVQIWVRQFTTLQLISFHESFEVYECSGLRGESAFARFVDDFKHTFSVPSGFGTAADIAMREVYRELWLRSKGNS